MIYLTFSNILDFGDGLIGTGRKSQGWAICRRAPRDHSFRNLCRSIRLSGRGPSVSSMSLRR